MTARFRVPSLLLVLCLGVPPCLARVPHGGPRNVLVIVADDVGADVLAEYDVGRFCSTTGEACRADVPEDCPHGDSCEADYLPMPPVMAQLRRGGVMFRNAWANPVCSPTRATIQTGRYGFRTGVGNVIFEKGTTALSETEQLIPTYLAATGYATAAFGKWHLSNCVNGNEEHPTLSYDHYAGNLRNFPKKLRVGTCVGEQGRGEDRCLCDGDCPTGETCASGFCSMDGQACDSDDDCASDQYCGVGWCAETEAACNVDRDCRDACDVISGTCRDSGVTCISDTDCFETCVSSVCSEGGEPCSSDDDCREDCEYNTLGTDYYEWERVVAGPAGAETCISTTYATTQTVDDALAWIRDQEQPWFAYVAFNAAHTPFQKPPLDLAPLMADRLPAESEECTPPAEERCLPGRCRENHWSCFDNEVCVEGDLCDDPAPRCETSGQECREDVDCWVLSEDSRACYLAMVEAMFSEISRLVSSTPGPMLANTTIIFVGDNGTPAQVLPPRQRRYAKGTVYQKGVHVPLIIAGAGVANPNRESIALVNTTDLFATVLELAGVDVLSDPPGPELDSTSLVPILQGEQPPAPRMLAYAERSRPDLLRTKNVQQAIRNDRYKIVRKRFEEDEFYDLDEDPFERNPIEPGESPPQWMEDLRAAMDGFRGVPEPCPDEAECDNCHPERDECQASEGPCPCRELEYDTCAKPDGTTFSCPAGQKPVLRTCPCRRPGMDDSSEDPYCPVVDHHLECVHEGEVCVR